VSRRTYTYTYTCTHTYSKWEGCVVEMALAKGFRRMSTFQLLAIGFGPWKSVRSDGGNLST